MSKLRDKFALLKIADDATTQEPGKTDQDFLNTIQGLGFTLNDPEQALRGQQWGKLGALDLLYTDNFFGQLMGYTDKNEATKFVMDTIETLDSSLSDFPQYNKLGDATKNKLEMALSKNRQVADMAFTISNFGLKGSGNGVIANDKGTIKTASQSVDAIIAELANLKSILSASTKLAEGEEEIVEADEAEGMEIEAELYDEDQLRELNELDSILQNAAEKATNLLGSVDQSDITERLYDLINDIQDLM